MTELWAHPPTWTEVDPSRHPFDRGKGNTAGLLEWRDRLEDPAERRPPHRRQS